MHPGPLILRRASASRLSDQWNDDDYNVPVGSSWLWTYGFDPLKQKPAQGYEQTHEAAMAAFKRGWQREQRV
jgi:hypothetical protein